MSNGINKMPEQDVSGAKQEGNVTKNIQHSCMEELIEVRCSF